MSVNSLFNIGSQTLSASQAALSVTSNNIANMNTPGYTKQDIILNIAATVLDSSGARIGNGVTVGGITRSYDRFVDAQLLGQNQNQGKSSALDNAWGQIEQVFNEPQGAGLSSSLADYFNTWQNVATNPSDVTSRQSLLQKAGTLTVTAQGMERSILSTISDANSSIKDAADQINSIATNIARLNGQIMQDPSAPDLQDQRGIQLTTLAKLVGFSSYENSDHSLTVTMGMRNLVSGVQTNQLSSVPNSDGNQELILDNTNITASLQSGQVAGLIDARNNIQTTALTPLRTLVASITQQVNSLHTQGYDLTGTQGTDFFNPLVATTTNNSATAAIAATVTNQSALTLDEYKITFDGLGNYNVLNKQTGSSLVPPVTGLYVSGSTIALPGMNVVISDNGTPPGAADSFTVSPLTSAVSNFGVQVTDTQKIAAAATTNGPGNPIPGDNGIALQIAQLTNNSQGALANSTFSDYYSSIVTAVGTVKSRTADSLTFDKNLLSTLQTKRDSISGVSLDEEAANLVKYQRSYQAGARMITVADELMQTIIALGSGL
jgi:flagellar hook-associated protein 1 FlgK